MAEFFIRRPIVAMVIAIVIVIAGTFTLLSLPVSEYPEVSPPVINVSTIFRGADAIAVEESVATPIEGKVNGVDKMLYMRSTNAGDGSMNLSVTFEVGTDVNIDQVNTQNRAALAEAGLPDAVKREGLKVQRSSPDILLVIGLYSPGDVYDALFLSNYASINLIDNLARINGVGEAKNFTALDYAMRIWVRPDRLASLGLTPGDVANAIQEQNVQAPAGIIGSEPAPPGQELEYTVDAGGLLREPEQFEEIIVRSNPDGSQVKVRDVARVEFGSQNYSAFARVNGSPGVVLGIYLAPGGNALETANQVKTFLAEAGGRFPPGIDYNVIVDSTRPITASMEEIVITLLEALVLVILVTWIFLQSWRATLIPAIAIPVSLIGTFMIFPALGFSLNTLSMFGLVLAIGMVVDDAIVVVEAAQAYIEKGLAPREATIKAMKDVTGPVVGTTLIMLAVFVPVGFMGGLTGSLYKQFAITIAVSISISSINALTLSPALCALLLRPPAPPRGPLGRFFAAFNRTFERATTRYTGVVNFMVRRLVRTMIALAVIFAGTFFLLSKIPGGFIPEEDKGYLFAAVELPDGASLQRTGAVMQKIEKGIAEQDGVENFCVVGGYNIMTGTVTSNSGTAFIGLKDWSERTTRLTHARAIAFLLMRKFIDLPEARFLAFGPPALPGFGSASGFTMQLQDRGGGNIDRLAGVTQQFLTAASQRPELNRLYTGFKATVPRVRLELDREKARTMGVNITDVFSTLQAYLGGAYVNDFVRFGRVYRVFVQAEPEFTASPNDIEEFFVRGSNGVMVPLSTLVKITPGTGPTFTNRFNLYRSAEITGQPGAGYSSAEALAAIEEVAAEVLPPDFGYEWSGLTYQEKQAEGEAVVTFALAIVFVFLLLAALYESWSLPFAVLLCSPLVVLGACAGLLLRGFDNNVYTQIGLIMLIGLSAKSAILIVEFARKLREDGMPSNQAAVEAAKQRLRPILMTVWSFALGCVPLALASGSGAVSRQVMGYASVFGTIVAGMLGIFFWPATYAFVQRLVEGRSHEGSVEPSPVPPPAPTPPTAPDSGKPKEEQK